MLNNFMYVEVLFVNLLSIYYLQKKDHHLSIKMDVLETQLRSSKHHRQLKKLFLVAWLQMQVHCRRKKSVIKVCSQPSIKKHR